MKYVNKKTVGVAYIILVIIFGFTYFIIYRTHSRVVWYEEMYTQLENLVGELRETLHINK